MIPFLMLLWTMTGQNLVLPVPLETPPFPERQVFSSASPVSLERLESRTNSLGDLGNWFASRGSWPSTTYHRGGVNDAIRGTQPPPGVETVILTPGDSRFHLFQVIQSGDLLLALYGEPPNRFNVVLEPRILVIQPRDGKGLPGVLDFLTYCTGPQGRSLPGSFTFQDTGWAWMHQGVLYISHAHRTYASASSGLNGYLTALDPVTLDVFWRSGPLVANAHNFIVTEEVIYSGYGFTSEADYLYVLDRYTGQVCERIPVPSAPEYLHLDGDRLFVRCYGHDLVFRVSG